MARLTKNIRLRSSTLVEVITAMVILMAVFGIGMYIFTNLYRSSSNLEKFYVQKQLVAIRLLYLEAGLAKDYVIIDSIAYHMIKEDIIGIDDRIKIKIYAERLRDQSIIDSLISIHEKEKNINMDLSL